MFIDERIQILLNNRIKQVFLYITDNCNLRCRHCLYKPELQNDREMPSETVMNSIKCFASMGATKLSLLGGEPTTYGYKLNHQPLFDVIETAFACGYKYLRMDTNGLFDQSILYNQQFRRISEITFSVDGHNSTIHDSLRGAGVFEKCIENIRLAVELGYNVHITCCVHKGNADRDIQSNYLIEQMIDFAIELGVQTINFHPVIKCGVPRDTWIDDTDIRPSQWINIYSQISDNIAAGKYSINVRLPQRFVQTQELIRRKEYYHYCPQEMGERVLIHPNGDLRICAFLIGTKYRIGTLDQFGIKWEEAFNELDLPRGNLGFCSTQVGQFDGLVPLCMSFKPNQSEFVWDRLKNQRLVEVNYHDENR